MTSNIRVYMDACCFIDLAKGNIAKQTKDREHDIWHVEKLLRAAEAREITVFSSILSVAECSHAEGTCDDNIKELFDSILTSGKVVTLAQCSFFTARKARSLLWDHGIKLKGADAIHIASALETGCVEFLTTDQRGPTKYFEKIEMLGLKVIPARETLHLPQSYRQTEIRGLRPAAVV